MKKNLIISCVGDDSLHKKWLNNNINYDICLIYYGDNELNKNEFRQDCKYFFSDKGEKYHLIKKYLENSEIKILDYDYVWLPDCDVSITPEEINELFDLNKKYDLWVSQPAMNGYVSHDITYPISSNVLRYTSFVEILAPLFKTEILLKIKDTFLDNYSGHGLDFVWSKILNYPENKIAVIDKIVMTHTKPIGVNYNRFKIPIQEELKNTMLKYDLDPKTPLFKIYSNIKN